MTKTSFELVDPSPLEDQWDSYRELAHGLVSGRTQAEFAREYGKAPSTVNNWTKKLVEKNIIRKDLRSVRCFYVEGCEWHWIDDDSPSPHWGLWNADFSPEVRMRPHFKNNTKALPVISGPDPWVLAEKDGWRYSEYDQGSTTTYHATYDFDDGRSFTWNSSSKGKGNIVFTPNNIRTYRSTRKDLNRGVSELRLDFQRFVERDLSGFGFEIEIPGWANSLDWFYGMIDVAFENKDPDRFKMIQSANGELKLKDDVVGEVWADNSKNRLTKKPYFPLGEFPEMSLHQAYRYLALNTDEVNFILIEDDSPVDLCNWSIFAPQVAVLYG